MREVTWEAVWREEMRDPVVEDQKWIEWSPVPPPVARREDCQGDQARAWMEEREREGWMRSGQGM